MFFGAALSRVVEQEIAEIVAAFVAFGMYRYPLSGVAHAVFHEIPENRIHQRVVAVNFSVLRYEALGLYSGFFYFGPQFFKHVIHYFGGVYDFLSHSFGRFLNLVYYRHVAYQFGKSQHLIVGTLQEIHLLFFRKSLAFHYRFDIPAYAAHRCSQFVGYVVAHLLLYHVVLFGVGYVVERYFEVAF